MEEREGVKLGVAMGLEEVVAERVPWALPVNNSVGLKVCAVVGAVVVEGRFDGPGELEGGAELEGRSEGLDCPEAVRVTVEEAEVDRTAEGLD